MRQCDQGLRFGPYVNSKKMPAQACVCIALGLLLVLLAHLRFCAPPYGRYFGASHSLGATLTDGYVLHLPSRHDRLANVDQLCASAGAAGVHLRVFPGHDGRACRVRRVRAFLDYSAHNGEWRNFLRGGEQGCLSSFLAIFASPGEAVIIVEDDAVLPVATFQTLVSALRAHADKPFVFIPRRAIPQGWPDKWGLVDKERSQEHDGPTGWLGICDAPNYSNVCIALTRAARPLMRKWVSQVRARGLHLMPADDLLSAACGHHPVTQTEPWRHAPPAPLRSFCLPYVSLYRLKSASDTEVNNAPFAATGACPKLSL
jgi:hypothetical protein